MAALQVTPSQKAALEAACEAFVPALNAPEGEDAAFWGSHAGQFHVADQILEVMADQSPTEQAEFKQLLGILESRLAGWWFGGKWAGFADLPLERRSQILRKWMGSRFNLLRKAFGTLKKLTLFLHYGSHKDHQHPAWARAGYQGPLGSKPSEPSRIQPLAITSDTELTCDVVIVGSGAGGGLAAGLLAEAGWDVILLEKGPFLSGEQFTEHEAEMIRKTYDKQGAFQSKDGSVTIFAGSCLGGGTTINWTGSFYTPDYVLQEWAEEHGLPAAKDGRYAQSMARVMTACNVNEANSPHNPQNQALWRGSEKLGEAVAVIARNVEGCTDHPGTESCGYCGLGCRRGKKRGTLTTYIQRAVDRGTRVVVGADVRQVLHTDGKAQGVEAVVRGANGQSTRLRVQAKTVVLAAGSIHTPAILLRSSIDHAGVGKNLYFHPTVGVIGVYDEKIEPWKGVMMSAVNKTHARLDGNYGYWIETPPIHAGVGAMSMAWESPAQHKHSFAHASNLAAFIVLTRDKFGGKVVIDRHGYPVVDYSLHPYDRNHVWAGMRKAFELHRAAGAKAITFPHCTNRTYRVSSSKMSAEDWLARMPHWGWGPNQFALFTAHQMGTCAMGGDPDRHPCDTEGLVRGFGNLYVADGSLMPSSAGINPMMPIMALADLVIQGLVSRGA